MEILEKRLSERPSKKDLQEANILPVNEDSAPIIVAAQKQLARMKNADILSSFFKKKDRVKMYKDSIQLSTNRITFGNKEATFDDTLEEEIVMTNNLHKEVKWVLEFNSYNQPFTLVFDPSSGKLPKGKQQRVKVKAIIQTLNNSDVKVKLQTPKADLISELTVQIKCKKSVFGTDPSTLACTLDEGLMVPSALVDLKRCLVKYEGMKKEGIFRLSGDQNVVLRLKRDIERHQTIDTNDVFTVAHLIKVYFRDLPSPLFQNIPKEDIFDDSVDHAVAIAEGMEEPKKSLLFWLVKLLQGVMVYQNSNRMSAENLAIVLAPNLYRVSDESPLEGLILAQKAARFFSAIMTGIMAKGQLGANTGDTAQSDRTPSQLDPTLEGEPGRRRSKSLFLGPLGRPALPISPKPLVLPRNGSTTGTTVIGSGGTMRRQGRTLPLTPGQTPPRPPPRKTWATAKHSQ
eukprot:TRINITY_DN644_c0_g1_i1.p1 TRINITY_DN644_c0_g1~~TRINITY_DN644_c0_g1_i1.p1  ORF type:complete len:458 (-),score=91.37 TRINITY_DN644_c0_g1_i1:1725-3098(-)